MFNFNFNQSFNQTYIFPIQFQLKILFIKYFFKNHNHNNNHNTKHALRSTRRATMLARPNEGKGQEKKQRSQICYQGRRVSQMCRAVALPNFSENYLSLNFSNVFTTVPWKNIPRLLLVPINFKVFYNITKVSWYFYLGPPHTHAGPLQCLNHMD